MSASPVGWILFGLGAICCVVNFYLSWLRYPLHRARGASLTTYRWVSGVPLAGSALVVMAWAFWLRHHHSVPLDFAALALALVDTGGIHWFLLVMATRWLKRRNSGAIH